MKRLAQCVWVLLALVALAQAGCLVLAAGAVAGTAAAIAYHDGELSRTYVADQQDTRLAVRAALLELGLPILSEARATRKGTIVSRSFDGEKINIELESRPGKIPVEGNVTHVGIRVGTFGDQALSQRLHAQIGSHLVYLAPGPEVQPPPIETLPPPARLEPPVVQTSAPPLATPAP